VKLDKKINLIDSPGVLFSIGSDDEDLVLRNCLKAEQLKDPIGVVGRIVAKCSEETLCQIYKIASYNADSNVFLQLMAVKKGKLKKGGIPNLSGAALSIILDWNAGKIPFYSTPPETHDIESSNIVQSIINWNEEFGISSEEIDKEADSVSDPLRSFTILPSSDSVMMGLEEVENKIKTKQDRKQKEKKVKEKEEDDYLKKEFMLLDDEEEKEEKEKEKEKEEEGEQEMEMTDIAPSSSSKLKKNTTDIADALNPQRNQQQKRQTKKTTKKIAKNSDVNQS